MQFDKAQLEDFYKDMLAGWEKIEYTRFTFANGGEAYHHLYEEEASRLRKEKGYNTVIENLEFAKRHKELVTCGCALGAAEYGSDFNEKWVSKGGRRLHPWGDQIVRISDAAGSREWAKRDIRNWIDQVTNDQAA